MIVVMGSSHQINICKVGDAVTEFEAGYVGLVVLIIIRSTTVRMLHHLGICEYVFGIVTSGVICI